jgi:hypothetical protein
MRRLLAWLAGLVGGAAVYRSITRKRRPAAEPVEPADPAEALKAKLAEARAAGDERDETEAGETRVDEAADPGVEARRRSVHERGRAAVDEMRAE